ncbi:hypothetical protein PM082_019140 [Marasmius tenuissimus]|nr:hypothetical protein PM082_019140 [Marasmius tenuissimus]
MVDHTVGIGRNGSEGVGDCAVASRARVAQRVQQNWSRRVWQALPTASPPGLVAMVFSGSFATANIFPHSTSSMAISLNANREILDCEHKHCDIMCHVKYLILCSICVVMYVVAYFMLQQFIESTVKAL